MYRVCVCVSEFCVSVHVYGYLIHRAHRVVDSGGCLRSFTRCIIADFIGLIIIIIIITVITVTINFTFIFFNIIMWSSAVALFIEYCPRCRCCRRLFIGGMIGFLIEQISVAGNDNSMIARINIVITCAINARLNRICEC